MNFDPDLVERLSSRPLEKIACEVFRVTRRDADPTAPSVSGGRWAVPQNGGNETSVLYTCLDRDGAIAEVVSYLALLNPLPKKSQLKVSRLGVSTSKTLRLMRSDLISLGIDMARYGERDYRRTQEIGSTLAWLGLDGLVSPSARWDCDNLTIFAGNHQYDEKLELVSEEFIEWRAWAVKNRFLPANP